MTKEQKERLAALIAKKKADPKGKGLTPEEFKEYKELSSLANSGNGKGKKDGKKGCGDRVPAGNPFASYNKFPHLVEDAGKIAMNYLPGTRFNADRSIDISGAIGIPFFPVAGNEINDQGGLNISDRDTWLKLHRKFRGLERYQSADVGIVFFATKDLFLLFGEIDRIYGVINYYDRQNRNVPDVILRAMGVSAALAKDIREHLADFRIAYNKLIEHAQMVLLPNDFAILTESLALVSFIYADSDSKYQQAIVFTSKAYGIYKPADIKTGGAVKYTVPAATGMSPNKNAYNWCSNFTNKEQVIQYVEDRISALVDDDDVQRIYSDMTACFNLENMMTMAPLKEDWVVTPVENKSILNKFHNMDVIDSNPTSSIEWSEADFDDVTPATVIYEKTGVEGGISGDQIFNDAASMNHLKEEGTWYVYQLNNVIVTSLALVRRSNRAYSVAKHDGMYLPADPIPAGRSTKLGIEREDGESVLDILNDSPSLEDVWEACMWKFSTKGYTFKQKVGSTDTNYRTQLLTSNGTELMAAVYSFSRTQNGRDIISHAQQLAMNDSYDDGFIAHGGEYLQADWAPAQIVYSEGGSSPLNPYIVSGIHGEVQDARIVHRTDYYRIHDISMLSLWHTEIKPKDGAF